MFVRLNASPSDRRGMAVQGAFTIPSMSTNNPCFSFVRLNAPPVFVRLNATPPPLTVTFTFTIDKREKPAHVCFVTHSMGGILLRATMARMNEAECRRVEAIVMLGPPNRGSVLAYSGTSRAARGINASLADMTPSPDSYVRNIPPPPYLPPVGVVAGKYDGKVALSSTLLPDGQPCERVIVPCTHPGLRDPKYTLDPILRFFRSKSFSV